MRIEQYNPTNMSVLQADVTGVDFGSVIKGSHAPNVVSIRPVLDMGDNYTALAMFLEDNAGLDHTQFGRYMSSTAILGITPGSSYLSDYLIEEYGISDISQVWAVSGHGLILDSSNPEYVWLDAGIGSNEVTLGGLSINVRFLFEYT